MKKFYLILVYAFIFSTFLCQGKKDEDIKQTLLEESKKLAAQKIDKETKELQPEIKEKKEETKNKGFSFTPKTDKDIKETLLSTAKKLNQKRGKRKKGNKDIKNISLNFINEDISNVVNKLAAIRRVNVIFPQPPAKISAKVTFVKQNDVTIDQAWEFIITVLDQAGYTLFEKENFFEIVKNENATREPLDLYVNSIYQLPDSDEKIRYLYFLNNIDIRETSSPSYTNLDQIIKDMLTTEAEGSTYILDPTTNSILIVGRSSSIKGIMKIVSELDTSGFPETIEVIPLSHTKADFISKMIAQLLPSAQDQPFRYGPFPARSSKAGGYYFSEQTKIIPLDRTNSIAVLGPPDSVERIKDFVEKHLDQPIESDKSIIMVKPLQYLNADELAPVLQDLVKARQAGAQAEATSTEKDTLANAIIVAEKFVQAQTIAPTTPTGSPTAQAPVAPAQSPTSPFVGGNRLIIAARAQDRRTLSKLIDELDQPTTQVAVEVLVVDLSITDNHLLGSQLRNMLNGIQPDNINFQAAHLTSTNDGTALPVLNFEGDSTTVTPQGLASDLIRLTNKAPYSTNGSLVNIPNQSESGATVVTFKDGNGIAAILQILDNYNSATVLSQPFVITRNNQQANFSLARENLFDMGVDPQSTGGPVIRKKVPIRADLTVNILPRISKGSDVNLEILVNVNDFVNESENFNIATRQVRTNANLKNKEVLVLGGLARVDANDNVLETPLLGKIPIIGFLFKRKSQLLEKRDLMIFISPTIIKPRIQGGIDTYTKGKIDFIKHEISDDEIELLGSNFEKLKDPITRIFFDPLGTKINQGIDYYAEQKAYKAGSEKEFGEIKTEGSSQPISEQVETNQPEIEPNQSEREINQASKLRQMSKDNINPLTRKNVS